MTPQKMLEDLKSGALRLVPGEPGQPMLEAGEVTLVDVLHGVNYFMPEDGMRRVLSAALAASPDLGPALIEMVEGLVRERDEALTSFANGAYDYACKRETGIYQHALAFTVEQFRKAEARALVAERERDALREALAPFAKWEPFGVHISALERGDEYLTDEFATHRNPPSVGGLRRAHALTKEQTDG